MSSAWLSVLANISVFGTSLRPGNISGQFVAEGANDGADLVGVDDGTVELLGTIGEVLVLDLPALSAGQALALFDLLAGLKLAAVPRPFRINDVDLVADIDAVGNGLLMGVLADDVLLEKSVGAVVRRRGQADEIGVEVFEDLTPEVVNRAVAFVDDDEVEKLGWNLVVIDNRHRFFWLNHFRRIDLFDGFVQLLALQERIHALDGADADLAVLGDVRRFETPDVVELGEFPVVVTGHVSHAFLLGLFAQMLGIYEKENPLGVSVFE